MEKNNWYEFSFEIDTNLEEIIIWKLNDLGISSFAFNILKKARMTPKSKEILMQLVKLQDSFLGIEKRAIKEKNISENDLKEMIKRLNETHFRVGMLSERFGSDLRKHFLYTTQHIFRTLPFYEN